ncbi:indolepyruvate decarboxylase [Longimycelium tulufanense]|uniref:Alpha-keto-acid decarboxylase n=1 Tax=Longimycelium tulufanense TaxID=907463 RepID=A0A8J3CGI6_9PSEU|nr:alpha-keto acid decarboxylase family protein [Longimycelium tulufanense]GGM72439.1 indolepyruvate decarboxylase [Longimycelium tulufanense]
MTHSFTVGDYLLDRLAEIGVRHLFGVPGDYNLAFLDHVMDHEDITWVGNANELNAAYAADGYARVNGVGALLTTYGVGELSAINGIAGSYAEYVPVVHVVGAPSTTTQRAGALVHHSLGDGDFEHFLRAYAEVTVAHAHLAVGTAPAEIDRVLLAAVRERRPGYLLMPTDVAASPATPPRAPLAAPEPELSERVLTDFLGRARELLASAGSATVLADFLVDRFGARQELGELLDAGHFPRTTLALGKGLLDESDPAFVGTYAGAASPKPARQAVEQADVVIAAGVRFTDMATAGFTQDIAPERMIDLQPFEARIGEQRFAPLPMGAALSGLAAVVRELGRDWAREFVPETDVDVPVPAPHLTQRELWASVQEFLRPGDIVVAEQGTSLYGAVGLPLPSGTGFVGQPLWGSIGYTLPAAFGAQVAAPDRRVVLLIGDGSALMTAQEIGSMLRNGLSPIVVLVNNDGYTVERAIHGAEQPYNDIARWNWSLVPAAMGAGERALTLHAGTVEELRRALEMARATTDRLVFLEVTVPVMDKPDLMAAIAEALATANAR